MLRLFWPGLLEADKVCTDHTRRVSRAAGYIHVTFEKTASSMSRPPFLVGWLGIFLGRFKPCGAVHPVSDAQTCTYTDRDISLDRDVGDLDVVRSVFRSRKCLSVGFRSRPLRPRSTTDPARTTSMLGGNEITEISEEFLAPYASTLGHL